MQTLKTALVLDEVGSMGRTSEQEADELRRQLLEAGLLVKAEQTYAHKLREAGDYDLVVLDYGSLSSRDSAGRDRAMYMVESCRRWADEHPMGVLMLWGGLFRSRYEYDLEQYGPILPNIHIADSETRETLLSQIRAYFYADERDQGALNAAIAELPGIDALCVDCGFGLIMVVCLDGVGRCGDCARENGYDVITGKPV